MKINSRKGILSYHCQDC